jgi:hypothetical protein
MEADLLGFRVKYFECPNCNYVQTEKPYWLDIAYSSAINISDVGIMKRNNFNVNVVIVTLLILKKLKAKVLDFAAGYGILVRLLRDKGG